MNTAKSLPHWPLFVIALPAAVAVWSGWVGLGQLCGFGVIHPLPGIWDAATVNTAITLPIGVEAYGSYALAAWLTPGVPRTARKFARWSAIGSLALGMLGQVAYHLLSAAHAGRAPWPVVVLVSSLPVIVLGFGAALSHLLRAEDDVPESAPQAHPEAVPGQPLARGHVQAPESAPAGASTDAPRIPRKSAPRSAVKSAPKRVKAKSPVELYATELAAGELPSLRRIRADMKVGQPKAQAIQAQLVHALSAKAAA